MAAAQLAPAPIQVRGCSYDGSPHWQHPALLLRQEAGLADVQEAAS